MSCGRPTEWRESGLAYSADPEPPAEVIDLFDDLRPVPDDESRPGRTLGADEPHVFYMNFSDGTESLTKGPDNAKTNTSRICGTSAYPEWKGATGCGSRDECRAEIADWVQKQWQDFNIVLVTKRPADSVTYSMEMIGPSGSGCSFGPGVGGIAPFDCGNRNEADVCYAFLCNGSTLDCSIIISQEEAHTFGLAHTNDPCDILYPTVSKCGDKVGFADKANQVNGMGCGGGTQNSYQLLKQVLGTWPPGMAHAKDWKDCLGGPPTVSITSPYDGDAVDTDFTVTADVRADGGCRIENVKITLIGSKKFEAEAKNPPYEWKIGGVESGDYLVKVTALQGDTRMQTGETAIAVHVEHRTACKADTDCGAGVPCLDGYCRAPRPHPTGCATAGPPGGRAAGRVGCLALAGLAVALAFARRRR